MLFWSVVVTDDRASAAATLASERRLTPQQVLGSPYFLLGGIDEITEQVEALRAQCGISYFPYSRGMSRASPLCSPPRRT
jgi:hypothetical protein